MPKKRYSLIGRPLPNNHHAHFDLLTEKKHMKKSKEEDGDLISESTLWRFFGLVIELLAWMSSCESEKSQILEMSRW